MSAEPSPDSTLTEDAPTGGQTPASLRPWLIYIGSPENDFLDAGLVLPLDDVRAVRFGRGSGPAIAAERIGSVLHIAIPLGWVSSVHAELRALTTSSTLEFDIRDLGSRNGTYIERQAVSGAARLRQGEIFEVGRAFFTVRTSEQRDLPAEAVELSPEVRTCSPRLAGSFRRLKALAASAVPMLIRGETGTGKDRLARVVHSLSGRKGPLVTTNLASIPAAQIEGVLFGDGDRDGVLTQAAGGTLFLDELGEISPTTQARLLGALTDQQLRADQSTEVRLLCATLHDLHSMVQAGRFRADLYSRIAGFEVRIPPLRARREDLGILCRGILVGPRAGVPARLSTRAFRRITEYSWPYNVRELSQTLMTATILAGGEADIPREIFDEILERRRDMPQSTDGVHELRAKLIDALVACEGDATAAATVMGRELKDVQRWLERFELRPENFRAGAGLTSTRS